jgi:hypothetical protein
VSTLDQRIEERVEEVPQIRSNLKSNSKIKKEEVDPNSGGIDEEFLTLPELEAIESELELIEFDGILNFRSALPGTGLPIFRCAALDNATASDTQRLIGYRLPGSVSKDSCEGYVTHRHTSLLQTYYYNSDI